MAQNVALGDWDTLERSVLTLRLGQGRKGLRSRECREGAGFRSKEHTGAWAPIPGAGKPLAQAGIEVSPSLPWPGQSPRAQPLAAAEPGLWCFLGKPWQTVTGRNLLLVLVLVLVLLCWENLTWLQDRACWLRFTAVLLLQGDVKEQLLVYSELLSTGQPQSLLNVVINKLLSFLQQKIPIELKFP